MKKKIVLFVLVVFVVEIANLQAQDESYTYINTKYGRIEVKFPAKPEEEEKKIGFVSQQNAILSLPTAGLSYTMTIQSPYGDLFKGIEMQGYKPVIVAKYSIGKQKFTEFEYMFGDAAGIRQVYTKYKGKIISLAVTYFAHFPKDEDVYPFFNSLKIDGMQFKNPNIDNTAYTNYSIDYPVVDKIQRDTIIQIQTIYADAKDAYVFQKSSDVDKNIPVTNTKKTDTYVLIIANENYMFVDKVPFAQNDGEAFKEYCIKTLGIPEKQVRLCVNASAGILTGGIDWLTYALNNFENSKAIVYYCGHGIPDEKTGDAYIIPTDGKGTNTSTCYSLNTLYTTLAATKSAQVTYFMDACFTGANKEGSMLVAARGIAREAKKETLQGKAIVFSAASGDETAMSYPEKQHGLFTYFLLKKLQETKGDVNYGDLAKYINDNVKKEAFLTNEKPQNPVVATSPSAEQTWRTMRLR